MGSETPVPTAEAAPAPTVVPLNEPADGVPVVTETARGLARAVAASPPVSGPVAIDAERASGYRYCQRAYLVQLRREGAGTSLIDPLGCPDLIPLDERSPRPSGSCTPPPRTSPAWPRSACGPAQLFDTELAGRLLGLPRVGLAAVVEHYLGLSAGEGALRGRLVHPAAARAVAALRRARRRGADRAARPDRASTSPPRASRSGRARSSPGCSPGRPPSAPTRGGARRA